MELSNTFVVLMGIGIVFFGLICIVFLCKIMSFLCQKLTNKDKEDKVSSQAITLPTADLTIPNRQEFIAAVSSVIAEELGTTVSGIKILSVKKL